MQKCRCSLQEKKQGKKAGVVAIFPEMAIRRREWESGMSSASIEHIRGREHRAYGASTIQSTINREPTHLSAKRSNSKNRGKKGSLLKRGDTETGTYVRKGKGSNSGVSTISTTMEGEAREPGQTRVKRAKQRGTKILTPLKRKENRSKIRRGPLDHVGWRLNQTYRTSVAVSRGKLLKEEPYRYCHAS